MSILVEEAVAVIAAEWQAAWNAHDMSRMAALLTDDADFVNVAGRHWNGKAEIEQVHSELHKTQFQASVWENGTVQVQSLKSDLALVHLGWSVRGDFDPDGTPRTPRNGLFSWLLVEKPGGWFIRAAHNTNIVQMRRASA